MAERRICREVRAYRVETDNFDTVFAIGVGGVIARIAFPAGRDKVEEARHRQRAAAWCLAIAKLADEDDFDEPVFVRGVDYCAVHTIAGLEDLARGRPRPAGAAPQAVYRGPA